MVINGKVYLQTQANLCQQGNSLALILLKTKLQSGEDQRLRKSLSHVQKDGAVLNILKRAMFDRLLTIRSFVFLDFNTYSESYLFHSLSSGKSLRCPLASLADDTLQCRLSTFHPSSL